MRSPEEQRAIREDIFRWLQSFEDSGGYELSRQTLLNYSYRGERIPLLDTGRGIRNPADFSSTLTLMSGWKQNQYNDLHNDDGWVTYSYQARDGGDNVKLIRAIEDRAPIAYFRAIREGHYIAHYPIVIAMNDPGRREVRFPLVPDLAIFGQRSGMTEEVKRYADRIVKQRLHQPIFRAKVMHAYKHSCAVCNLRHPELLDAAHILSDASEAGVPHVTNGLSLCKIHHTSYDVNLLGITPDYVVRINEDLLNEVDGPMLRHGLQEMHGRTLQVPDRLTDRPSQEALAARFAQFAA